MKRDPDKQNRSIRNSVGRAAFVVIAVCLQVTYLVLLFQRAGRLVPWISTLTDVIAFVAIITICSQRRSADSKTLWTLLILIFPVLGLCLFFFLAQPWSTRTMRRKFRTIDAMTRKYLSKDRAALSALEETEPERSGAQKYLEDFCGFPLYGGTQVEYHGDTKPALEALKRELRGAERFIFMEYHAIELSSAWLEIEEILIERAQAGVEVRVFYDDIGSAVFIDRQFIARLEAQGIHCRVFNPIMPFINAFMNNRDHRKITVIDDRVAFTGGYNLTNAYFNRRSPYGYWKDAGIMLRGAAVRSLTVIFLEMWNAMSRETEDVTPFLLPCEAVEGDGYVQPYADSPLDRERVGENVYLYILKTARRRAWITTPYLILSDEMMRELILCAKRGVDVRIVTPGIPDKKLVYRLTRSYYHELAHGGVKIYEYTPGFLHAKQMLIDDRDAVVGTINLDYRSLYFHFENAVLLHGVSALEDMAAGFEGVFNESRDVTESARAKRHLMTKLLNSLLKLFAPLL